MRLLYNVGRRPVSGITLDTKTRRTLRQIAHHLDPVVTVGHNGVTDAVLAEVERALTDHELIKVRIHDALRLARKASRDSIVSTTGAELIQTIGKIIVLYRHNADADPELSNVTRASAR